MDCADVLRDRDLYILAALTPEERAAIDVHMSECPLCQSRFRSAQFLTYLLRLAVVEVVPSATLRSKILARATSGEESTSKGNSYEGS